MTKPRHLGCERKPDPGDSPIPLTDGWIFGWLFTANPDECSDRYLKHRPLAESGKRGWMAFISRKTIFISYYNGTRQGLLDKLDVCS
jgi:hypothetical protein